VRCTDNLTLHAFFLRETLRRQAEARGIGASIAFGRELICRFPSRASNVGPIVVEPELRIRVQHEGSPKTPIVVARRSYGWRLQGTLRDDAARKWAAGQPATRLRGGGPSYGHVWEFEGDDAILRVSGKLDVRVHAADYALRVNSTLLRQVSRDVGEADLYKRLRVETGSWDRSGRVNRYAVKDRQHGALELLEDLGLELKLPDGGTARIDPSPVEIRLRANP
jgi:hypothetical protein